MTARIAALSRSGASGSDNRGIVVFPHAGGSPRFYAPWCKELPAGSDLYGVTYPGRDQLLDEPAPDTLVDLAADCAAELRPIIQSSGAPVLFGHSMGAYIAFEAARSLARSGIAVTALVVSAAEAPHVAPRRGAERALHRASDDELVRHAGELDARGREVLAVPELRRMFLPIIRDDYRLVENYRAEPNRQLPCPIHILYGESDPEVDGPDAAAWAAYTRADSHVRTFAGDHFYIAAHTAGIVGYLSDILARA